MRLVTFLAENRAPDFRLKRHAVVFAAVVANDLKPRIRVFHRARFFRTAFSASLRLRHILLIKKFLILFSKKKNFLALNTWHIYVGHFIFSFAALKPDVPKSLTHKFVVCNQFQAIYIAEIYFQID